MNSAEAKHKMVVGCDEHNSTALNNKHYTKKGLSKVPTRRQKCFHVIAERIVDSPSLHKLELAVPQIADQISPIRRLRETTQISSSAFMIPLFSTMPSVSG